MNKNILICGVGGQGTVLSSRILASAFMSEGHTVHSAETIGMAQRGGSVVSHVRVGDEVYSPLIPEGRADLILAFEPKLVFLPLIPYHQVDGSHLQQNELAKDRLKECSPVRYEHSP